MLATIVFYIAFALVAISALLIVFTKNILYAAFLLLLTLLGISVLYIFMAADFLAITQIVVYVGGVLVLLLFGIMLTHKPVEKGQNQKNIQPKTENKNLFWAFLIGISLFILLSKVVLAADFVNRFWIKKALEEGDYIKDSSVSGIGINLVSEFLLPFEIIALILLIALIGASLIAGRK